MAIDPVFHSLSIEDTFAYLQTSSEGLSRQEVERRRGVFGLNTLKEEKISKVRIFFRQYNSVLNYILFLASFISLLIGEFTDFFVINSIIFVNGVIGFWQEYKAEISIAALKKQTETQSKVVRDGQLGWVSSSELVPGDYMILHEGEVATADIRLVETHSLMVDESSITGESIPIVKDHTLLLSESTLPFELKNMLLAGTIIMRGSGRGIVVKTGSQTYFSKIIEKAQEPSLDTPLTVALRFFSRRYVVILIGFLIGLGIFGYFQGRHLLDLSYFLLASLVSAVPEGLPIVVTLVMVVGAVALQKRQTFVRYLPSVETLGSATVIASDKTGTITEGKLVVKEVYAKDMEKLRQIAALCNDAHEGSGDPLDVALADWVEDFEKIRSQSPREWAYAFDAKLMLMATINRIEGKKQLLVKGAFESLCEKVQDREGLKEIEGVFDRYSNEGLRVLAFGTGDWTGEDPSSWKIKIIGLIGFLDPPKEGVKEAVYFAKKAHVRVLMVTGDHPQTAKAVAQEVGIWTENDSLLTGKEIEDMPDLLLLKALRSATILARILPEHKYRVVKLLQASGEIVAVTGDGINDVPALKAANIGIGMGSGTEAAKMVSKMVIANNNLKVIIEALKNARVIADNIRKVIYYLISTSLQGICLISLAILFSLPIPLAPIQILWINIVSDGVQDKTFPFAKEEGDVMRRKPRRPEKQFFDLQQLIRILIFGITLGIGSFFLYRFLIPLYPFKTVSTIVFLAVVMAQWANGIQAQKEKEPFFKNLKTSFTINPWIFAGLGMGIILQGLAIYLIPDWFHSTSIPLKLWRYPIYMFLISFGVVEFRKWVEFVYQHRATM